MTVLFGLTVFLSAGRLVVDAFGSDAIPVHLVTREALEVYRQKLVPSGWLVFHISSRYVDLRPVLARLAADAGFVAYGRDDLLLTPHDRQLGRDPSRWLAMVGPGSDLSCHHVGMTLRRPRGLLVSSNRAGRRHVLVEPGRAMGEVGWQIRPARAGPRP
jgi:hypothetical protein